MYNVVTDCLIEYETETQGVKRSHLPDIFTSIAHDDIITFPLLRPHQRQAWHAFLVQLGAIAMHRAGETEMPSDWMSWSQMISDLTPNYRNYEPWECVVDDFTMPAFMQPPVANSDHRKDYKNVTYTPDGIDILVTSKNHDIKMAVAKGADINDWIFALVTQQTMNGFSGGGNYGIARMNGGLGNRHSFSLAPNAIKASTHVMRDIYAIHEMLPLTIMGHRMHLAGHPLLWTLPWSGEEHEMLEPNELHPLFVEVCRRIRLQHNRNRGVHSLRASSKAPRINAKSLAGIIGDPWSLVMHQEKKDSPPVGKSVTMTPSSFGYKQIVSYLSDDIYEGPVLLQPTIDELEEPETMMLVFRTLVRGQGKTEGYHERHIPVYPKLQRVLARIDVDQAGVFGAISRERVEIIAKLQRILSHAIQMFVARGEQANINAQLRAISRPWLQRLDHLIDLNFFEDLQKEFEAPADERVAIRNGWLLNNTDRSGIINQARAILKEAQQTISCPQIHYYKGMAASDGVFEGRIHGENGFPELFAKPDEEQNGETEVPANNDD